MSLPLRAERSSFAPTGLTSFGFEYLEPRRLLSVSQSSTTEELGDHESPVSNPVGDILRWDFWQELFVYADLADSSTPVAQNDALNNAPLPIIPPDQSIDPFVECPRSADDFCLPSDSEIESNFDFQDFLRLRTNYGTEHASRDDGDLDGDTFVSFTDFLILASRYGG